MSLCALHLFETYFVSHFMFINSNLNHTYYDETPIFFDELTCKTPVYLKYPILISVSFYNVYQFQPKSHLLWRNPFFLTSSLAKLLYTWNIHYYKSVSFYQKIKICQHNSIRSHLIYDTQMIFVFFLKSSLAKRLNRWILQASFYKPKNNLLTTRYWKSYSGGKIL